MAHKSQRIRTPGSPQETQLMRLLQQMLTKGQEPARVKAAPGKPETRRQVHSVKNGSARSSSAAHRAPRASAANGHASNSRPTRLTITSELKKSFKQLDIRGHGGFQSFCTNLREEIMTKDYLVMEPDLFKRIIRYATQYGEGGFQQRLRMLLALWTAQHAADLVKAA